MATVRQLDEPVLWIAGEEEVLSEVVKLVLVTDPAEVGTGLSTDPDTGVATGQGLETGLSTEPVLAWLTAEPGTVEVRTLPETWLLARLAGLGTGLGAVRVSTPGLAGLGAEAGQATRLSTDVTALERTITHPTTRDVEPGPVTGPAGPGTLVATVQGHVTRSTALLGPVSLIAPDGQCVTTVQFLLDLRLTPGGDTGLVSAVNSTQTEGEMLNTLHWSLRSNTYR